MSDKSYTLADEVNTVTRADGQIDGLGFNNTEATRNALTSFGIQDWDDSRPSSLMVRGVTSLAKLSSVVDILAQRDTYR